MREVFAKVISWVTHPVFVNLLSLKLLFISIPSLSFGIPESVAQYYILFIFLSTSIVPILMVLALRVLGRIDSIYLKNKEERNIPYLITLVMYLFCLYNFWRSAFVVHEVLMYLFAVTMILGWVFVINHKFKISIHMVTLGALFGLLMYVGVMGYSEIRYILIAVTLFSGLTGTARIILKAHKPREIFWGFYSGAAIMFSLMLLYTIFDQI